MAALSTDLRRRLVDHYLSRDDATYRSTAEHFSVGEATVSRMLRLLRESGDIVQIEKPRAPRSRVDLEWLGQHAAQLPDARLKDRVADYFEERGVGVSITAMWAAMKTIGWTHKKRRFSRGSGIRSVFRN